MTTKHQMIVANIKLTPDMHLNVLSKHEVNKLLDKSQTGLYHSYRKCSLAILNSGSHVDDAKTLLERYADFDVRLIQLERGIRLELINAPAVALVDGKMIQGIKELLFAVLRDIIYASNEITDNPLVDTESSDGITNAIFHILRNAGVFRPMRSPNIVVCWGGHSIGREEYEYTKVVGYQHRLWTRGHEGAHERRHHWPCQTADPRRPLYWHVGARHYCRRAAQPHC
jgi:pyrimidine/purine-5'-nucleotide nucleosidase